MMSPLLEADLGVAWRVFFFFFFLLVMKMGAFSGSKQRNKGVFEEQYVV